MDVVKCVGGCLPLFLMAIVFDGIGLILLFIGVFANLRFDGRFYGDFLIYSGSLIMFFSLGFWVMWYVGNVQVPHDDGAKKRNSIVELARKLSERLSQKLKGEDSMKCVPDEDSSQVETPPRKGNKVTWGKSTTYDNTGFDDDSTDSLSVEKKVAST